MRDELTGAFGRALAGRWSDAWLAYGLDLDEVNDFVESLTGAMFDPEKRRSPGDHWQLLDGLDEETRELILDDLCNLAAMALLAGVEYGRTAVR
jgi:hypothetical protein